MIIGKASVPKVTNSEELDKAEVEYYSIGRPCTRSPKVFSELASTKK